MEQLAEWVCNANEAIELALVLPHSSLKFHPDFSYPFFGEEEKIFGYKNLKLKLHYSAGSLNAYLGISYSNAISSGNTLPQDVIKQITAKITHPITFNYDQFLVKVKEDERSFKPMGEKIHEYQINNITYEYYRCDFEMKRFKDYHRRLQTFVLWFIEGASFIEDDDERWQCVLVYRKSTIGVEQYTIVGYATYYPFYHFPDKLRMRISQVLILPPFQGKGHGYRMYEFLYNRFLNDSQVVDITVEDPNDAFQDMRDRCDIQMLLKNHALAGVTASQMTVGHLQALREKFKLCERQAIRCSEILLLKATLKWDAKSFRDYRIYIKKRLYKKNKDALMGMEFGDRLAALQHTFDAVEEDYRALLSVVQ
ncbi:acyl-CoA N-acyltransferase [Globomyces pollinis-pini]|nr:acyl-CoA N-acyltransferase [Globomyces pollinis-pini]